MNFLSIPYKTCCQLFLWVVFVISVFVDMYNGYCQHYLNTSPFLPSLYKGSILFICLSVCFWTRWGTFFKGMLVWLFIYVLALVYWILCEPYFNFFEELNYFIKFSFPYWVFAFLLAMKNCIFIDDFFKLLTYYGVIAASSIIILFYLGVGVSSYGETSAAYGFGTKGFFTAGNDIGLILLLTNCLLCYLYLSTRRFKYLLEIIVVTVGTIMLGTMAGVCGSIVIWMALIYNILFLSKKFFSPIQKFLFSFCMLILLSILVYNVMSIFSEDHYMQQRFDVLLSGDSRAGLKVAAEQVFENFNLIQWGVGRGFSGFGRSVALNLNLPGIRLTEMDMHDVLGFYGIIVGGAVLLFSFYMLYVIFCRYMKCKSLMNFWGIIIMCLFIGHGYFAGHAYSSPQSSLLFVGVAFIIFSTKELTICK